MHNGENNQNITSLRLAVEPKKHNLANAPDDFNPGSLAFQRTLMEFLDEFTEVISGELRYLEPPETNR